MHVAPAPGLRAAIRRYCVAPGASPAPPDGVAFTAVSPQESEPADRHQLRLVMEQAALVEGIRLL